MSGRGAAWNAVGARVLCASWARLPIGVLAFLALFSVSYVEHGVLVQLRWSQKQTLYRGEGGGSRLLSRETGFGRNGAHRSLLSAHEAGEQEGRDSSHPATILQHRHKRRDRCRHQPQQGVTAGDGQAGPWQLPAPPAPGTLAPWDEERVPPAARDAFLKWRQAEYAHMVHDRHLAKFGSQLHEKPKLDAAIANGTLMKMEDGGCLAWYTTDSEEELKTKLSAAQRERDMADEQRRKYRSEMDNLSKELGFELPPSLTSPLPDDRPQWRHVTVSFLLQFYKHSDSVVELTRRLWECTHGYEGTGQLPGFTSELIVNVDSRGDAAIWDEMMVKYNQSSFVSAALSNNLHEVHGYNRIASMARGEVLILMQDDQLPPESCTWLMHLVKLFRRHQYLGAVGVRNGDMFLPVSVLDTVFKPENVSDDAQSKPWEHCREGPKYGDNIHRDPELGLPFDFVTVVDMAPLALRAEAFRDIGMFDEGLADPGECGILHDWELSTRMWLSGWQVGLVRKLGNEAFTSAGVGGTHVNHLANALCWVKQPSLFRVDRTSDSVGREIMTAVIEANKGLTLMLDGQPPWVKCCTKEKERVQRGEYEACPAVVDNTFPDDWPTRRGGLAVAGTPDRRRRGDY